MTGQKNNSMALGEMSDFENEMVKLLTPTAEDLKREISNEQLRELCLKRKLRVRMELWNPVHDYVRFFNEQGRLQSKTPKAINKLLTKAVNRHKATHCYTEEEKRMFREEDWANRKKYHLLLLDLWAYERNKKQKEQSAKSINEDSLNNNQKSVNETNEDSDHDSVDAELANLLADGDRDNPITDYLQFINPAAGEQQCHTESLTMALNINTESLSIGTEELQYGSNPLILEEMQANMYQQSKSVRSENSDAQIGANVEIPELGQFDYDEFNHFIPLTSTQSQHTQSQQSQPQTQSQFLVVD